jgi:hypothetical protein
MKNLRYTLLFTALLCVAGIHAQTTDVVTVTKTDGTTISWPKANVDSIVSTAVAQKVFLTIPLDQIAGGKFAVKKKTDGTTFAASDFVGHKYAGHSYYVSGTTGTATYCMVYYFASSNMCFYYKTYDLVNFTPADDSQVLTFSVSGSSLKIDTYTWAITAGGEAIHFEKTYGSEDLFVRVK